ncbi:GDSL-like Lipase/Acylhydrolase superfamily protein [Actinidia rufa]|uniref:GDSL-like Lipase/Acylhydrolase superfamily protein n=1 Tax=Actinidia rufa TaxID=165716 RepID=A0A7J0FYH0_9ERIC|nr:GDSL-like Lipase/Acylhydrolase superfamily protein [Actinidia rufa]
MMNSMGALLAIVVTLLGVAIDGYHCKVVQFIFGDSLSDVGNNNYLSMSLAKANLPWYGIDFGTGLPNGRFSNGRTVADIIGDQMGLPRPPAFLDQSLTEDVILDNGVNYASGGAGILNETGGLFIQRLSLYKQIELFQGTQELIKARIGEAEAEKFFQNSRYVVALGSNDFINNYLMPIYSDSWTYTQQGFITYIMETLQAQLTVRGQEAHGVWARPYGLHPPSKGPNKLPNASFQFGDAYDVVNDVIINPYKYGFNNSDSPCCSFGKIRPALTCIPASTLCKDRSKYVFWDEYHPSDKANELIANELIRKLGFVSDNNTNAPSPAPAIAPSSVG